MKTVTISGHSDDLVEVKGDILGCNEYTTVGDEPYLLLEFSSGDVIKVTYGDAGIWYTEHYKKGTATVEIVPHSGDEYTDKAIVSGELVWIDVWYSYPPNIEEYREKLGKLLCNSEFFDTDNYLTGAEYVSLYNKVFRRAGWNGIR
jgi:hypothetical protein